MDKRTRLEKHVEALLAFVDSRRPQIDALREACDIDIFCGVHSSGDVNCGFVFEPELSRRLGELGLPIVFDLY